MKRLLVFLVYLSSITAFCQANKTDYYDTAPSYIDGQEELQRFLAKDDAAKPNYSSRKEGKIIIRFLVKTDGTLDSFSIVKDLVDFSSYEYANAIIKSLNHTNGRWIPATLNGNPVDCFYSVPVYFISNFIYSEDRRTRGSDLRPLYEGLYEYKIGNFEKAKALFKESYMIDNLNMDALYNYLILKIKLNDTIDICDQIELLQIHKYPKGKELADKYCTK